MRVRKILCTIGLVAGIGGFALFAHGFSGMFGHDPFGPDPSEVHLLKTPPPSVQWNWVRTSMSLLEIGLGMLALMSLAVLFWLEDIRRSLRYLAGQEDEDDGADGG